MEKFIYILPVLLTIAISIVVVKIASVALKMTGMDDKTAYFQALSAFTGTGFTTKDSELVLQNSIRRKIIIFLMILGNVGFITVMITLVVSFQKSDVLPFAMNIGAILAMVFLFYKLLSHKGVAKFLNDKIESGLEKSQTLQKKPVEEVLRLAKDYGIAEVNIKSDCKDLGKQLSESSFRENDILVLAIERKNSVIPTPKAVDRIMLDDTLICYGKLSNIERNFKTK